MVLLIVSLRFWLLLPDEDVSGVAAAAVAEGCLGPRYLAQAAVGAFMIWASFMLLRRRPA